MAYPIITSPKLLISIVANRYKRKPHVLTCTCHVLDREQNSMALGVTAESVLGMLKLVKLLERRTENRSIDRDPLPLLCNLWLSIISWIKLASVPPAPLFRKEG